jgi:2-keto-4-pentenoate hydratase
MDDAAIRRAIELFGNARLNHTYLGESLDPELHPEKLEDSYKIQDGVVAYMRERGAAVGNETGIKIGLVTAENREVWGGEDGIGIPHPTTSIIYNVYHDHVDLHAKDFRDLYVECEVAVRMKQQCPASDAPYSKESIGDYVGEVMAGIEVVDWSIGYRSLGHHMGLVINVDNAANSGGVFGVGTADWRDLDLSKLHGRMDFNGREIASGIAADLDGPCVGSAPGSEGHPFNVLAWTANHQAERGRPLQAGQYVLLGSVCQTQQMQRGATATMTFEGIGEVSCSLD